MQIYTTGNVLETVARIFNSVQQINGKKYIYLFITFYVPSSVRTSPILFFKSLQPHSSLILLSLLTDL